MNTLTPAEYENCLELLQVSPPFLFLTEQERIRLAESITVQHYTSGEVILDASHSGRDTLFLVFEGLVRTSRDSTLINVIKPGHYFGEHHIILDEEYVSSFKAMRDTGCYKIPKKLMLELIRSSKVFAEAIGTMLRDDQGIFSAFEEFIVELQQNMLKEEFNIHTILPAYLKLCPALHTGANSTEIDFNALQYAIKRLPENVSSTFFYLLTDDLPTEFLDPDSLFPTVVTAARRRNVWQMLPGKNMVLIRSGYSDFLDIVTCLCVYATETKKLRIKLHNPKLIRYLGDCTKNDDNYSCEEILEKLPFSDKEQDGLIKLWGTKAAYRLQDIVRHREKINFHVRRRIHNYNMRRMEQWTQQIGLGTKELTGYLPNELPEECQVHIISSNSHSVTNCLNPYLINQKDKIIEWGFKQKPELMNENWCEEYDKLYAVSRYYFKANPENKITNFKNKAIKHVKETASTGIEVQLFDCNKLFGQEIDPELAPIKENSNILLVNIDYAFGEQAEDIIRNLIFLFGRNLRSINIMGKAGSLVGQRGDILLPSGFIEQSSDSFHPISNAAFDEYGMLQKKLQNHSIYSGQLLTVSGTLLQNKMMLNFYHNLWDCIGLEMEGFYYYRQILKSVQLGVIPENLDLRFLYYVSDLPLEKDVNLAAPLLASEGIPPLYAVTRHILNMIFSRGTSDEKNTDN